MTELELKFSLDAQALVSLREALRARGARRVRLAARYFDTADARLAERGISLRLRREGGVWRQTLKATGASRVQRFEHEVPVRTAPGQVPALDLERHADAQAQALLRAALGGTAPRALVERFVVEVDRLRLELCTEAGSRIEIALDTGQVLAAGRRTPIAELELELKAGPVEGLFDLAQAWAAHGGLCLSTQTKSQRGEHALSGQAPCAVRAPPLVLSAAADGPALWRQVLRAVLDPVLAHAGALAEGDTDAERVHQLRVGLRRLRTALRELAALGPAIAPAWTAALSEAFARLGDYRDEESMVRVVGPLLQAAALVVPRRDPPDAAQVVLAVRAPAFQAALVALLGLAHADGAPSVGLAAGATRKHLAARLERLHRRVADAGQRFRHLSLARQHRVRKQLKRLRYLAEFVRSLWPARAVERYLGPLQPAQDALGAHNDLAVAAQRFTQQGCGDTDAAAAAQFLHGQLALSARRGQRALRGVGRAPRFWG